MLGAGIGMGLVVPVPEFSLKLQFFRKGVLSDRPWASGFRKLLGLQKHRPGFLTASCSYTSDFLPWSWPLGPLTPVEKRRRR